MPALTKEQAIDRFLQHVKAMSDYWAGDAPDRSRTAHGLGPISIEERLDGLAFSILVAIDGEAAALPGFKLCPWPHKDDKKFLEAHGESWYPEEPVDIAGDLHGEFAKKYIKK